VLDLVVANALIVDGRGTAPFRGSLGVRGDRIVWIRGGTAPPDAARTIDGDGLVLAPGFIDVHNHSDLSAFVSPDMPSAIRQGVTTVIVGNCGTSAWPLAGWVDANRMASGDPALDPPAWETFGDYLDATDAVHPATNIAARDLCDALLDLFSDRERGGFFQTGSDADELVVRPKDLYDNAVPSGNSAATEALLRLALFTGEARYEDAAVSALQLIRDVMTSAPGGFGQALCALDLYLGPSYEVAIVGGPEAADTKALLGEVVRARWRPNLVLAVAGPKDEDAAKTVALLVDRRSIDERATAYVCQGFVCRLPVTEPSALTGAFEDGP
jgi:hypothetical protein